MQQESIKRKNGNTLFSLIKSSPADAIKFLESLNRSQQTGSEEALDFNQTEKSHGDTFLIFTLRTLTKRRLIFRDYFRLADMLISSDTQRIMIKIPNNINETPLIWCFFLTNFPILFDSAKVLASRLLTFGKDCNPSLQEHDLQNTALLLALKLKNDFNTFFIENIQPYS